MSILRKFHFSNFFIRESRAHLNFLAKMVSIEFLMRYILVYFLLKFDPCRLKYLRNTEFSSCRNVARTFLEAFGFWLFHLFRFVLKKYVWYKFVVQTLLYPTKKRLS